LEAVRFHWESDGKGLFDDRGEAGAVVWKKEEDRGCLVEDVG
jgi:hypothetical protein